MLALAAAGILLLLGAAWWVMREIRGAATPVAESSVINEYAP